MFILGKLEESFVIKQKYVTRHGKNRINIFTVWLFCWEKKTLKSNVIFCMVSSNALKRIILKKEGFFIIQYLSREK